MMQQQERHHPRVTFALPPPSPSPPTELQHEKGSQLQLIGQEKIEGKRPVRAPPALTAAQLIAHAAGPPNPGGTNAHVSQSLGSSSSSHRWTLSYPRLRRVPDGKPLTEVDSNTTWPGGVIAYQRLPSCYDSLEAPQATLARPTTLANSTRLASASTSTSKPPRMIESGGGSRGTTSSPRPKNSNPPSVSGSRGTNSRPSSTSKQPWTWTWTPGAEAAPIHDPDYADGTPECLSPRPAMPTIFLTDADAMDASDPSRIGRSIETKRLRGGEDTASIEQDDARSNVSGSSTTGSFITCPGSELFASELGGVGTIGTVASVWGEPLSDFRGLRL